MLYQVLEVQEKIDMKVLLAIHKVKFRSSARQEREMLVLLLNSSFLGLASRTPNA